MSFKYLRILALTFCFIFRVQADDFSYEYFYSEAKKMEPILYKMRRELHQIPELFLREYQTSNYIKEKLEEFNVNYTSNWGINPNDPKHVGTGVIADIGTGKPPCVALRADFDGLPIFELVDIEYRSKNDGKMHACGHDAHTAWLLGAAKILKENEQYINGTVRLLFQPGEEGGGGGALMVQEGALTQYPPVQRAFGLHVNPEARSFDVMSTPGPFYASANDFTLEIKSAGGPQFISKSYSNPITTGAAILRALYDIYSEELFFQKAHTGLITVSYFEASGPAYMTPEVAYMGGTLRALSTEVAKYMEKRVKQTIENICKQYNSECNINIPGTMTIAYPATINDPELYQFYQQVVAPAGINGKITPFVCDMGGEDFSFFAQEVPSIFSNIGTGSGDEVPGHPPTNYATHSAYFAYDDRVSVLGVAINCHTAIQNLKDLAQ